MTMPKDPIKQEIARGNYKEAARKRASDPCWIRENKEMLQKRALDPEWRRKNKESNRRLAQDPVWQNIMKNLAQDPKWRDDNKKQNQKTAQDPEWLRKNNERLRKLAQDPEYILKRMEKRIGGFWYGNIRYFNPQKYCELWCPDLWHRIDKSQNYQSILSGKTKFENGGRALDRHHVYWQPKACCGWDEDTHGYYAMINIGTVKKPNWYKYYIPGDPNKFVLLTKQEHGMIMKDKLKWIKIFEDLIETKLCGECYLPKK